MKTILGFNTPTAILHIGIGQSNAKNTNLVAIKIFGLTLFKISIFRIP
ncbi:unknown [Prevotella sp. CAG:755]|nr:unknown [Prevotella sp. CAG:755]